MNANLATTSSTSNASLNPNIDWHTVIKDWQASGLSVSQFCRQHQLTEHKLYYYRRKFLDASDATTSTPAPTSPPSSGFTQVAVLPQSHSSLTLRFPNGVELSGFSLHDTSQVAELVRRLL